MNLNEKTEIIKELLEEKKGVDIKVSDAPENILVDRFVICSATSAPHLKTLFENVKLGLREKNIDIIGMTGYEKKEAGWMIVDTGDIIVHMLSEEKREYYELEELWKEYLEDNRDGGNK